MKIATWNINGVKARLEGALTWLRETNPDVACLQEIKSTDRGVSRREAFEELGYNAAVHGQKGFNGVAILSKRPFDEVVVTRPARRRQRRATPATSRCWFRARAASCASAISTCPTATRSAPTSSPTSSPGCSASRRAPRDLLELEEPFVLLGDYNVIPEPVDAKNPKAWREDALFQPETRAAFRALLNLGLTDALRACHPRARHLHVLGLSGRRLAEGPRHPHRPHPAVAAGRRPHPVSRRRQVHARLGEAVRPRAGLGRVEGVAGSELGRAIAIRTPTPNSSASARHFVAPTSRMPEAGGAALHDSRRGWAAGRGNRPPTARRARRMSSISPFSHALRLQHRAGPRPSDRPSIDGGDEHLPPDRDDAVGLLARGLRRAAEDVLIDVIDPSALVRRRVLRPPS